MDEQGAFRSYDEARQSPEAFARYWHGQIRAAKQRRTKWLEDCEDSLRVYRQETASEFNIHYANVRTRAAARFNSSPIPDVRPSHLDNDRASKAVAQLIERGLIQQQDAFDVDAVIKSAVLGDEICGQGQVRVYWEPEMYTERDDAGRFQSSRMVRREFAKVAYVPHGHYLEGPATVWDETPWIAYKMFWTRQDLETIGVPQWAAMNAGKEDILAELSFDADPLAVGSKKDGGEERKSDAAVGHVCGWQIWHRETRTVVLIAEDYEEAVLFVDDDPLPRLPGFYPSPRPLQMIEVPGSRVPVCPYALYRQHAANLDEITRRIHRLTKILRYRGFRAAELEDLNRLEELGDGEFAPLDGATTIMSQGGSLDAAIWAMPVEKLVVVLRELIEAREQIKATVYEVTGISEAMRGHSDPGKTATANNIEAQFGTQRVGEAQGEVARFVRDVMRLQAEIIATHFGDDTLMKIAAPQGPEETAIAEQALQMLRSDETRFYRVDVETDSTIRGDVGRAQQNAAQWLDGTARYTQAMLPLIQQGVPAEPILKLYGAFTSHYKLGKQAEMAIEEMIQLATAQDQQQQAMRPQRQAEQEQLRSMATQAQARGMMAEVAKSEAEAQKTALEAQGQAVENEQQAMFGPVQTEGFVQ